MDWPSSFVPKSEIKEFEAQEYTIVPYTVESDRGQPVVFAAIVYDEIEETVSGHYYHPDRDEWVVDGVTDVGKVIPQKHGVFEGGLNIFGEPGREVESIRKSIGDTLSRYLSKPPFMYDNESAAALQPGSNVGDCDCSPDKTDQLGMREIPVRNGNSVPIVGCPNCSRPYRIGTPSKNTSVETVFTIDWGFPQNSPNPTTTRGDCEFYHVDPPTDTSTHFAIAALIAEVNSEVQFAQDYNVETDEFFLVSVDNDIVGFLSWNQEWGVPSLTQLYIRPESRGNGYSKMTLQEWTNYISGELAYAEHMNEASRPIFRDLGLLEDGESEFTVREFIGIDVQRRRMDSDFYETFSSTAFPDELGVK